MTGIGKSTYSGSPLELLVVTGFRLPVYFALLLLQRIDRDQKKGISECCTTFPEPFGIYLVDV
jgi:hypothetical protein